MDQPSRAGRKTGFYGCFSCHRTSNFTRWRLKFPVALETLEQNCPLAVDILLDGRLAHRSAGFSVKLVTPKNDDIFGQD